MAERKYFTKEEIDILSKNPYVEKVSETSITYTNELREEFYKRYQEGERPTEIMTSLGFDKKMLGTKRIASLAKRIKQMMKERGNTKDTRKGNSGRPKTRDLTPEQEIAYLKHKLAIKEQENEFLKKIRFVDKKAAWKQQKKNTKLSKKQ